jgi:hypothetical protein
MNNHSTPIKNAIEFSFSVLFQRHIASSPAAPGESHAMPKVLALFLALSLAAPFALAAGDKYCAVQIKTVEHQVVKNGHKETVNKQAEEHDAEHFRRMLERCSDNASQSVRNVWTAALAQVNGKLKK